MIKNIAGQLFGRLTALSFVRKDKHGNAVWNCLCSCGKRKEIAGNQLRSGKTRSCGCLVAESSAKLNLSHGHAAGMHGAKSPTYRTWRSMINRCYRKDEDSFQYYGGKGVTVCNRWRSSFENFLEDMGPRPDGHTLDRIDSSGNYEPVNCRWADSSMQSRNRGVPKNNTSGHKNVFWRKNRWLVIISIDGKKTYFGSFKELKDAATAAEQARRLTA